MKTLIIFLALSLTLSGCLNFGGKLSEESKNKTVRCTDLRDGEVFTYKSNTVTNIRIGTDSSFDFVDTKGNKRTARASHEVFLKCKLVKVSPPTQHKDV